MVRNNLILILYLILSILVLSCKSGIKKTESLQVLVDKIDWLEVPEISANRKVFRDSLMSNLNRISADNELLFIIECFFSIDQKEQQGAICYFRQNKKLVKTLFLYDKFDLYRNLPHYELKRIRNLSDLVLLNYQDDRYCYGSTFCKGDILNFYYILGDSIGSIQFLSPHYLLFEKEGPLFEIFSNLNSLLTFSKMGIPFCVEYF